jgi:hypothetical protein
MGNGLTEAVERASGYPTVLVCVVSAGDVKCGDAARALRSRLPGWAIFHVIECGSLLEQHFIQDNLTAHIAHEGLTCGDIFAYTVIVRESAHAAPYDDVERWWRRAGRVASCVRCLIYTPLRIVAFGRSSRMTSVRRSPRCVNATPLHHPSRPTSHLTCLITNLSLAVHSAHSVIKRSP